MSATNRGGERLARDAYYTDPALAEAIVRDLLPIRWSDVVVEPHAGDGAFFDALYRVAGVVRGFDLAGGRWTQLDWLDDDAWERQRLGNTVDWIVGNPPYAGFEAHVDAALARARNVAFLLRHGATDAQCRREWWSTRQPSVVYFLTDRPKFRGLVGKNGKPKNGTDQCAYSVFVWRGRAPGPDAGHLEHEIQRPAEAHLYSWRLRRILW